MYEVHLPFHQSLVVLLLAMRTVLVLTALVAVGLAIPHPVTMDQEWNEYKKEFGKFYTSQEEDNKRLKIYLESKETVEVHNRKYERGETSYTMELNKFADWFPEELDRLNGLKVKKPIDGEVLELPDDVDIPAEIDWVKKGAVTRVKDQGGCASCYAFSAAGALEGLMFVKNKTITDLSVQELIDCTEDYQCLGCLGGFQYDCFRYVADRKGISTNKSYPYEGMDFNCRAEKKKIGSTCTGYVMLPTSERALKKAVGILGPVSICFGVSYSFILYKDGIFDGDCGSKANHGMLAVGYGKDKKTGKNYWLVKNSWGVKWGMKGYVKIERGVNKCWISYWNSYPTYKK